MRGNKKKAQKLTRITIILVILVNLLSGCYDALEPDSFAFVVALGIDKPNSGHEGYEITLQFANPSQISGGSSEEGGKTGKDSINNITVNAPDIYSAVNLANHMVSKTFTLSHTKLIVFSEEIAKEGVGNFLEMIGRSSDIRPNTYFAVSKCPAKTFLDAVDPKTEVNPVRYYTMIFENDYSGFVPGNMGLDFFLYSESEEKGCIMPLCNIAGGNSESQGSNSSSQESSSGGGGEGGQSGGSGGSGGSEGSSGGSGSGGGSEGGSDSGGESSGSSSGESGGSGQQGAEGQQKESKGQSSGQKSGESSSQTQSGGQSSSKSGESEKTQYSDNGYQYKLGNYEAGMVSPDKEKGTQVIGMALFQGDKFVGEMKGIETEIYNILTKEYKNSYVTYYFDKSPNVPVTLIQQSEKAPKIRVDTKTDTPKIYLHLNIEADYCSSTPKISVEDHQESFIKQVSEEIKAETEKFLKMTKDMGVDAVGFGSIAKKNFVDMQKFDEYQWKEKYKNAEFHVMVDFDIRRTGLMVRSEKE